MLQTKTEKKEKIVPNKQMTKRDNGKMKKKQTKKLVVPTSKQQVHFSSSLEFDEASKWDWTTKTTHKVSRVRNCWFIFSTFVIWHEKH